MRLCWAQYLLWLVISIMGTGTMLTSCGQKGDLYLPKKASVDKKETAAKTHKEQQ